MTLPGEILEKATGGAALRCQYHARDPQETTQHPSVIEKPQADPQPPSGTSASFSEQQNENSTDDALGNGFSLPGVSDFSLSGILDSSSNCFTNLLSTASFQVNEQVMNAVSLSSVEDDEQEANLNLEAEEASKQGPGIFDKIEQIKNMRLAKTKQLDVEETPQSFELKKDKSFLSLVSNPECKESISSIPSASQISGASFLGLVPESSLGGFTIGGEDTCQDLLAALNQSHTTSLVDAQHSNRDHGQQNPSVNDLCQSSEGDIKQQLCDRGVFTSFLHKKQQDKKKRRSNKEQPLSYLGQSHQCSTVSRHNLAATSSAKDYQEHDRALSRTHSIPVTDDSSSGSESEESLRRRGGASSASKKRKRRIPQNQQLQQQLGASLPLRAGSVAASSGPAVAPPGTDRVHQAGVEENKEQGTSNSKGSSTLPFALRKKKRITPTLVYSNFHQ